MLHSLLHNHNIMVDKLVLKLIDNTLIIIYIGLYHILF